MSIFEIENFPLPGKNAEIVLTIMCDLDFADFSHFCEKMQFSSFSAIFRQVSIKQTATDSDICQVDLELFLLGEMCFKKV